MIGKSHEASQFSFWEATHPHNGLTLVEEQPDIGPHFLSIGKTRKIVSHDNFHYLFFSAGYQIKYVVVDSFGGNLVSKACVSGISPAWGGYNFCVDEFGDSVHLAYTTIAGDSVGYLRGKLGEPRIEWESNPHLAIIGKARLLAAPWIAIDEQGMPWISVVGKGHNFYIAKAKGNGFQWEQKPFLQPNEDWIHSVIQLLPTIGNNMVAIGFAGNYPKETQIQYKCYDSSLREVGGGEIAACNVNDRTTFHFQAVSDQPNRNVHIVYLDDGLSISHAMFDGQNWNINERIVSEPSYSPQITADGGGNVYLLYADYQNRIKLLAFEHDHTQWTYQGCILESDAINISQRYAATYYGTGGCISIACASNYLVPFLTSYIDDKTGLSKLYYGCLGFRAHLRFARVERPLSWNIANRTLQFEIKLIGLKREWLQTPNQALHIYFRLGGYEGQPWLLRLRTINHKGDMGADLFFRGLGGWQRMQHEAFETSFPCSTVSGNHFSFHLKESRFVEDDSGSVSISMNLEDLKIPKQVDLVDAFCDTRVNCGDPVFSGEVVDIWPFQEAPNTICAKNPDNVIRVFKRIL